MANRKLLIFSAPSGSGKSSIVNYLLGKDLNLEFSVSATSRQPRGTEINGKDYYFISAEEFKQKIADNEFVEWEEVYKDHFYGTLKSELDRIWGMGNIVIFDVDVTGGLNLKKIFKDRAAAFFIMPPSINVLEERLINRGTDNPENIKMRVTKATHELEAKNRFDYIIVNDELIEACKLAEDHIRRFLEI